MKPECKAGAAPPRWRALLPQAVIVVACLGLFATSLDNEFVWDDKAMLADSTSMTQGADIVAAFSNPYLKAIDFVNDAPPFYRPISLSLLMLERQFFGDDPTGYRILHALLHLINALLIYLLTRRLLQRDGRPDRSTDHAGLFAALIFISLPYTVEAVCFLTDIGNILSLMSILVALRLFLAYLETGTRWRVAGILVVTAIGAASKETAVVIPFLLLAAYALYGERPQRIRAAVGIGAPLVSVAAFLAARWVVLDSMAGIQPVTALLRIGSDLATAIRWSAVPYPLSAENTISKEPSILLTCAGIVALLIIVAAVVFLRRRNRMFCLAMVCWLVSLLPALLVLQLVETFPSRYLYIPGAFLSIAVAQFATKGRLARLMCVGLVAILAVLALVRIAVWDNSARFWLHETELNPNRPQALTQLGKILEDRGETEKALSLHLRAVENSTPASGRYSEAYAHTRVARIYLRELDRSGDALDHYRIAVETVPSMLDAWLGVGNVHARDGAWDRALTAYETALRHHPDNYHALVARAGALAALGRFEEALGDLDRAAEVASGSAHKTAEAEKRRNVIEKLQNIRHSGSD